MSPRAGRRARAYGDRGAGTDGAGRPRRGASPERGLRSSRSAGAGGSEFVPVCRGPPRCADLGDEKDRVGGPVFQHIRAFQRGTKISTAQCSRVADGSATGMSLCARALPLTVIASPALLWCWRWLSATSTSTRLAPRPGATTRARAGRGRRPSAAAGWTARGSCRCAAVTAASCPPIWLRVSIRWPATSPSGFSPGRSCRRVSAASPPPP